MQPYIFPYLGYFQLIKSVDIFIFYDDVNFIKKGFINRNYILVNSKPHLFTIPCKNISQNDLIKDIALDFDKKSRDKFFRTLSHAYSKAPYYEQCIALIRSIFEKEYYSIADLAITSLKKISAYLDTDRNWKISSQNFYETIKLSGQERIIEILKQASASEYINMIGGKDLYQRNEFLNHGIELNFLKSSFVEYKQFKSPFISQLSIIDVLMFNSIEEIKLMINNYELC